MNKYYDDVKTAYPLFGNKNDELLNSPRQFEIEQISVFRACQLNELWHSRLPIIKPWNIFGTGKYICFGLIFNNEYHAVAIWSGPVANFKNQKEILELRRLAICEQAPRNTASWFISKMIKIIKTKFPNVKKLISYQDLEVHLGTIYKASNWIATGFVKKDDWARSRNRNKTQAHANKIRWEYGI